MTSTLTEFGKQGYTALHSFPGHRVHLTFVSLTHHPHFIMYTNPRILLVKYVYEDDSRASGRVVVLDMPLRWPR